MEWYEIEIRCGVGGREALSGRLPELGCAGTVEGENGALTAYFPAERREEDVIDRIRELAGTLRRAGVPVGEVACSVRLLPEQDWNETWKESFEPIDVNDDIVILPPWLAEGYTGGRFPLYIDPGMAFGTGHHPTTRDCVRAISKQAARNPARGAMLDLGTGTGVLAIHAALLGYHPVTAIDNDPVAADAAHRNLALNGLGERIHVKTGDIASMGPGPYTLISANLLLNILVEYLPRLTELLTPDGAMVLSGILEQQEQELRDALDRSDLRIIEVAGTEWRTLVAIPLVQTR